MALKCLRIPELAILGMGILQQQSTLSKLATKQTTRLLSTEALFPRPKSGPTTVPAHRETGNGHLPVLSFRNLALVSVAAA
jgi:hypothetical protein